MHLCPHTVCIAVTCQLHSKNWTRTHVVHAYTRDALKLEKRLKVTPTAEVVDASPGSAKVFPAGHVEPLIVNSIEAGIGAGHHACCLPYHLKHESTRSSPKKLSSCISQKFSHTVRWLLFRVYYSREPLSKGHFGACHFEAVLFSDVNNELLLRARGPEILSSSWMLKIWAKGPEMLSSSWILKMNYNCYVGKGSRNAVLFSDKLLLWPEMLSSYWMLKMNCCYGQGVQKCVLCWEVVPLSEGPLLGMYHIPEVAMSTLR